jgi:hypothetical protein
MIQVDGVGIVAIFTESVLYGAWYTFLASYSRL